MVLLPETKGRTLKRLPRFLTVRAASWEQREEKVLENRALQVEDVRTVAGNKA